MAIVPGVTEVHLPLLHAQGNQPLGSTKAFVRMSLGKQLVGVFVVQVQPLGLIVGPFIPVQPQPTQAGDQILFCFFLISPAVGILDAQDKRAVVMASNSQLYSAVLAPPT